MTELFELPKVTDKDKAESEWEKPLAAAVKQKPPGDLFDDTRKQSDLMDFLAR